MPDTSNAVWRKSTFSQDTNCVEVAPLEDGSIAVRDSKHPDTGTLVFTHAEWDAFTRGVAAGEFKFA